MIHPTPLSVLILWGPNLHAGGLPHYYPKVYDWLQENCPGRWRVEIGRVEEGRLDEAVIYSDPDSIVSMEVEFDRDEDLVHFRLRFPTYDDIRGRI